MKLLQELLGQKHDVRHLVKFPILYYGGCRGTVGQLLKSGYSPSVINSAPLILTSTREMAQQNAGEKNCNHVIIVSDVPAHLLTVESKIMDIYDALERVQQGDKLTFKLTKQLGPQSFKILNKLQKSQYHK